MTVTIDQLESFIQVFRDNEIQEMPVDDLRKAIRNFWNVASEQTVDDRIQTLDSEGWIEPEAGGKVWKINHEQQDEIAELFRSEGKKMDD